MKLRIQFLTDDEGGHFHIGGAAGIDIFRVARYWGLADGEALWLYNDLYQYPKYVETYYGDSLDNLFSAAEAAIGLVEQNRDQGTRPYELILRIDGDLFRFSDTGMKLDKLRKYFAEGQITDIFFKLKNLAGEVLPGNKGLKFEIHPDEHGPHNCPHVHVSTSDGSKTVILGIPDGNDLSKGLSRFPKNMLAKARDIVIENHIELMDEWRKAVDGKIRIKTAGLDPAIVDDLGPCKGLPPRAGG